MCVGRDGLVWNVGWVVEGEYMDKPGEDGWLRGVGKMHVSWKI